MKKEYDITFIGGGIGSLIGACFLSKAGYKVAVVEKSKSLGGYCSSFVFNDYFFNSCVRGLVGCERDQLLGRILSELGIYDQISFLRPPVYDHIKFLNYEVKIHQKISFTFEQLVNLFPKESKNIEKFFNDFLFANSQVVYKKLYSFNKKSFQQLLDIYFNNEDLKYFFKIARIDSGEPASITSAIADISLIRGNFLQGGYYPKGGFGNLIALLKRFLEKSGADIFLEKEVASFIIKKNLISNVECLDGDLFKSKVFISGLSPKNLLDRGVFDSNPIYKKKINKLKPSTSVFIVYVALDMQIKNYITEPCSAIWSFPDRISDSDLDQDKQIDNWSKSLVVLTPSLIDEEPFPSKKDSLTIYSGVSYKNVDFWTKNKKLFEKNFLNRLEGLFPNISKKVVFSKSASPVDLKNITNNYMGATRGWAPLIRQVGDGICGFKTPFKNLFNSSHWVVTNYGCGGVAWTANTAKRVAAYVSRHLN